MSNPDIIRVLNEMQTFTGDDVEKAFEIPHATANLWLRKMLRDNIVVRFRVGHEYVYALSPRMEKRANALPPVDLEERCLPLSFEGVTGCDCACDVYHQGISRFYEEGRIYIRKETYCPKCGDVKAAYVEDWGVEETLF